MVEESQTKDAQARAEAEASTAGAAAAGAQNPFSSITAVFIQQATNVSEGPLGRVESEVHLLPIIPTRLGSRWTVTTMVNVPLTYQPILTSSTSGVAGLGDVQPTFFFVPRISRDVTWGIGPAFNLPTATKVLLSTGRFSVGPAMVLLWQPGNWTFGTVVNYLHSVAGPSARNTVNQVNPSYFINYNLQKGWYLTTTAGLTGDWTQPPGSVWKVPFGGGVGRVLRLGPQLVNVTFVSHVNAMHKRGTERWGLFLQVGFLYPRKPSD